MRTLVKTTPPFDPNLSSAMSLLRGACGSRLSGSRPDVVQGEARTITRRLERRPVPAARQHLEPGSLDSIGKRLRRCRGRDAVVFARHQRRRMTDGAMVRGLRGGQSLTGLGEALDLLAQVQFADES